MIMPALSTIRAVLLDMDGVLYVGDRPLPGVQDFLDYLDATGRGWLCITNNASKTPEESVAKLARMNVTAGPEHIFNSAQATAGWLAGQIRRDGIIPGKTFMFGMSGLRAALLAERFTLTDDPLAADYVVAGANFNLTYEELAQTAIAINNGARFVGTNPDKSFPTERGHLPGTGAILALLEATTGVTPEIVGKPNPAMFELAMQRLGVTPAETLMVGDRYDTDIAGAVALGMPTAGVLTGITTAAEFAAADPPPALVTDDLPALLELFRAADGA